MKLLPIMLAAGLLLAACGEAELSPPPTHIPSPALPGPTLALDEPLAQAQSMAVVDLAARLRVEPGQIEVISAEPITWSDGSLGCPQPDQLYTQALVDGYRVILGHAERVFLYHAGTDAQPFLCASDEQDGGYDFVPPPGIDI
jgi:hypothetical protein